MVLLSAFPPCNVRMLTNVLTAKLSHTVALGEAAAVEPGCRRACGDHTVRVNKLRKSSSA
jgi:hypothetical protein